MRVWSGSLRATASRYARRSRLVDSAGVVAEMAILYKQASAGSSDYDESVSTCVACLAKRFKLGVAELDLKSGKVLPQVVE